MNIVRHTNALADDELGFVAKLLKDRTWTVQASTEGDRTRFFMSVLSQHEIDFFHRRWSALVNRYVEENRVTAPVAFERAYINCHPCFHPGHWHMDNVNGFTLLYFPEPEVDFGDDGGTDIEGFGYQPYVPNSLIIFPANAMHMAREHTARGVFRYSVAFKFKVETPLAILR